MGGKANNPLPRNNDAPGTFYSLLPENSNKKITSIKE
jgi:hypothetical protein